MRLFVIAVCSTIVAFLVIAALVGTNGGEAAWPGEPGHIAFAQIGTGGGIGMMDSDGSHRRLLTSGDDIYPSWTSQGAVLLYSNGTTSYAIVLANGDLTPVTLRRSTYPSAVLDNSDLLYSDGGDIMIGSAIDSGGSTTNLTNTPNVTEIEPVMSPNGSMIAFSSNEDPGGDPSNPMAGLNFNLWLMDANGANRHILWENDAGTYQGAPDWSPDGTRIAFADNNDIWITPTDANNQTDITNDPEEQRYPAWSPDGKLIAYAQATTQAPGAASLDVAAPPLAGQIWTIDPDSRERKNITNDANAHDSMPDWQPICCQTYVVGDTLCDGRPDPQDALAILVYLSGIHRVATGCFGISSQPYFIPTQSPTPSPTEPPGPLAEPAGSIGELTEWGDWNCSGDIDPGDAMSILAYVAGVPYVSPTPQLQGASSCIPVGEIGTIPNLQ